MATNKKNNRKGRAAASKKKKQKKQKTDHYAAYVVVSLIVAVVLSIFVYGTSSDGGGLINGFARRLVFGLFGWVGYIVPLTFFGYFLYLLFNRNIKRLWIKIALVTLALCDLSAIIGLSSPVRDPDSAFYYGYNNLQGGGWIGAILSNCFRGLFQTALSYMIFGVLLVILLAFIASLPLKQYLLLTVNTVTGRTNNAHIAEKIKNQKERFTRAKRIFDEDEEDDTEDNDYIDDDEFYDDEGGILDFFGIKRKEKPQIIKAPKKKPEIYNEEDEPEVTEEPPVKKPRRKKEKPAPVEEDFETGIDEVFADIEPPAEEVPVVDKSAPRRAVTVKPAEKKAEPDYDDKMISDMSDDELPDEPQPKKKREQRDRADKLTEKEKKSFTEELDAALDAAPPEYVFPPIRLLNKSPAASSNMRDEMRQTAENLISVLSDFGVKAKLLQVTQGPAVTRYEIQPDTGTKLSKITGLAEDIALNLAVPTVLVAPVPGKAAVGIEIPNKKVSAVSIREIIESPKFYDAKSKLTVGLGKDIGGNVVVGNIAKWPHILIAGQTGSGKSVCINTIITSLLYKASPEDVRLIMIDPKVVELSGYNGIPHLLIPVVSDPKKAAGALSWAVTEMMRRYDLFKETGVRKLEGYNTLMEKQGGEKLYQIVIIIDELADLMMVCAKEVEDYICRLTQLARAAGIHLIIATQRPSVDVITGLIKANVPSRIAFSVASQVDSRTILDKGGAEKLLGMGDMLYYPTDARNAVRVQGAYVSDEEIESIIEFIKGEMGEAVYSEDIKEQIENSAIENNPAAEPQHEDDDPLLQDAIKLAIEMGKISTSMVQRRMGVGYARAGRLIDRMEQRGIISGANGSKPRDVLVSHADMLNAVGDTEEDDYEDEEE